MLRHRGIRRLVNLRLLILPAVAATALAVAAFAPVVGHRVVAHRPVPATAHASTGVQPNRLGLLDCNGLSPIQRPLKVVMCTDPRGSDGGRFVENGHYIGHDEPSVRFISTARGSGRNFTINETLPIDPKTLPTVAHPGSDVTHMFELTIAPWFSMDVCDPNSAPLLPCTPGSDANAPRGRYPGGGAAFVELQFYPPGDAPFADSISCDNKHWCSALTIDSLECTGNGSGPCNNNCVEPVNFAFVSTNGVPAGPPSPQLADLQTDTPNKNTLLMNPGDKITVRMFDAKIKGGHALEVVETDHSKRKNNSGFMIASAANGFMNTDPFSCEGTKFNFEPEYNTARAANIIPWGIGPYMINDQFEIGHFEPCTSVSGPGTLQVGNVKDAFFKHCAGPYESPTDSSPSEPDDSPCYKAGDTHNGLAAGSPDLVTGCPVFLNAVGDLDFDGTPYWADWPSSTRVHRSNRWPTPFLQSQPTTSGRQYPSIQFVTDLSASEQNTNCNLFTGSGCVLPPKGPGKFYPFWTQAEVDGSCVWEFGNMRNGNTFGGIGQYGKVGPGTIGAFVSKIRSNPNC